MQPNPTSPARTRSFVLAVCLVFPFALQLYAASPPLNDTCEDAEVIPPTAGLSSPYFTAIVSDFRSATTNGEPPLTNSCGIDIRETIWYSFQPTSDGLYTFSTAFDTATTLADPVIGIYTAGGGCSSTTPLPQIDCNDDSGGSHNRAAISTTLSAGTQYYIVIWSAVVLDLNDVPENYSVQIRVSRPATPDNDSCGGAQLIPADGPFPFSSSEIDNTLATDDGEPSPSCAPPIQDGVPSSGVWYEFTPQASDTYIFSTGADTATTVEDTLLAIYSTATQCGTLTPVVCNNNSIGRASVSQALAGGTRYYIVVWDNEPEPIYGSTLVQLRISRAAAPTVDTLDAINIASTGALFKGMVNPNGLQTRYWFEWGPTAGLGSTSQVRLLLGGTTAVATESTATAGSPLAANVPYHYQIVSTNLLGASRGPVLTFVWSDVKPALMSPILLGKTSFRFEFNNGNPKQLYMIQGATDLGADPLWTDLGLAINLSSTVFRFTHTGAAVAPYQFYRVRLP
jgi:hypothetical protein